MYNYPMRKRLSLLIVALFLLWSGACSRAWSNAAPPAAIPVIVPTAAPVFFPTLTLAPTHAPATATAKPALKIWVDPALPQEQRQKLTGAGQVFDGLPAEANLRISLGPGALQIGQWIYALVAPFPTLVDGVSLDGLQAAWRGVPAGDFKGRSLLVDAATRQVFERSWGPAGAAVRVVATAQLLDTAWQEKTSWAIVPFEALEPRWKVLRLDGRSPYDKTFDPSAYGLSLPVSVDGDETALSKFHQALPLILQTPFSNRDPKRLTVLVMTGTSALVRGTAAFMQQKGLLYPGRDIGSWLRDADITHVSNEVSFDPKCPPPDPNDPNLRFCSDPKNIQLFEDVGVDVVEMTGNHINDFGSQWVVPTIEMYHQRNWLAYGAGANQAEARKAVTIEHNGNTFAFIGCNPAGPKPDWATDTQAGTADCDYPNYTYLRAEIQRLAGEGYLPIVTIQYFESLDPRPLPIQFHDFRMLSDAGAVIVSGSQAHLPQAMELRNQGFIHYGLGNLFFDQMDTPWPDTKYEFIDRHVFYNGRYLGVELLTAQIEDWVKPRPMTPAERAVELAKMFDASGWPQTGTKEWSKAP
jgi:hypothetical protein